MQPLTRPLRRRASWAVLAAVALVAGGCADDTSDAESQDRGATPPATRPPPRPPPPGEDPGVTTPVAEPQATSQGSVGGPVPDGFVPVSISAISADTFWVLGTAPCGHEPCTSLVRTTDGGLDFIGLPAPVAQLAPPAVVSEGGESMNLGGDGSITVRTVSDVRFADARNGWIYGGALFVTHDGGGSWRKLRMPGMVVRLEAAGGIGWALVDQNGRYTLYRSRADSDDWRAVEAVSGLGPPAPDLDLQGEAVTVLANSGDAAGRVLVSTDQGGRFAAEQSDCRSGLGGRLSSAVGALWLVCPTGTQATLMRSTDHGLDFATADHPAMPNSAVVGAVDERTAVLATGGRLRRTMDGGETWQPVTPSFPEGGSWRYLGFTNPQIGYGVRMAPEQALYRTTDGGAHWQQVGF